MNKKSNKAGSKSPDATASKEPVQKRTRSKIYGDRVTITVRLPLNVHKALGKFCEMTKTPQNTYLNEIIKDDLKEKLSILKNITPDELDE